MEKKILIETIMPDANPIRLMESKDGSGKVYLEGIAIQGEKQNHNGRIYPKEEIENAVNKLNETITKFGPVLGECDHPEGLSTSVARASHLIEKMWMDGNNGNAKFLVVPYGLGEIVHGFIKFGARLGVSSRGSGNVDSKGRVSDFDIVTIDVVANPSAPDAYPSPIFESVRDTTQGRKLLSLADAVRNDKSAQKFFKRELLSFMDKLGR